MKKSLALSAVAWVIGLILICAAVTAICGLFTGCGTTPPSAVESKFFDVTTNYTPVIKTLTNYVYFTNEVTTTVNRTNEFNLPVIVTVTNYEHVAVPMVLTYTNYVPAYEFHPNTNAAAVASTIGTITNTFLPGTGGIVTGILGGITTVFALIRSARKTKVAATVVQGLEVGRNLLREYAPEADLKYRTWLRDHQTALGVSGDVANILRLTLNKDAAAGASEAILGTVAQLQSDAKR